VELAMENLRRAGVLSIAGIRRTTLEELEALVRPAGYFRQKAARLKHFVAHLDARYEGSLEVMFAQPLETLRTELLGLSGIGPETADSILLYAASREVFVVDAYTRRIFERHGLAHTGRAYEEIRSAVETALTSPDADAEPAPEVSGRDSAARASLQVHAPSSASAMARSELSQRYNEFHALLVQTAKHYCLKAAPHCQGCPLRPLLPPKAQPR
jgi:endonuclease-3 related protein